MLHLVRRHNFPVVASFRRALAITYALPRAALEPLLAPGLELDALGDLGFAAIALVQADGLRPVCFPRRLGRRLVLAGYRIFARFRAPSGRSYRGLQILRSETDSRLLTLGGNLVTRYRWRRRDIAVREEAGFLHAAIRDSAGRLFLEARADLRPGPVELPPGSPFGSWKEARRFAGPLPYTFSFEPATRSMVIVEGTRSSWSPRPVRVDVASSAFLESEPFRSARPVLAAAFLVEGISYRWERGIVEPIDSSARESAPWRSS